MTDRRSIVASMASAALLSACVGAIEMTPSPPVPRPCTDDGADSQVERVEWYHPVGAGDNESLEAWCDAVGPIVIDPVPAGDFGPSR